MPDLKPNPAKPVLLIEDDEDIRDLVTEVLETEGYAVSSVACAADALRELAAPPYPALILVDLTLPDMPGAELLRRIGDLPARRHAKVLLCSGQGNLEEQARELHADGCIRKPYDLDLFIKRIASVLP